MSALEQKQTSDTSAKYIRFIYIFDDLLLNTARKVGHY